MRAVSRDHARTNRNGVRLDYLEAKGERKVPPIDLLGLPGMNPFRNADSNFT